MREIVLCAHDPGGYDVIYPVFEKLRVDGKVEARLFLAGPAGEKRPEYRADAPEILRFLSQQAARGKSLLAVTGTSWNSDTELQVLRHCKEAGIPSVSILDYWSNYKSRFQCGKAFMAEVPLVNQREEESLILLKDPNYIFPDYYFVMDETAAEEAAREGIDRSIMRVVGQPGLDAYVRRRVSPARNQKLLFLSQPLSAASQRPLGYTEFDAVRDVLRAASSLGYSVDMKFHPKETERMRREYESLRVEGDLPKLVSGYAAVVGMSTMGLLQCALMGIPVVSYQPNLTGEDLCITNKLHITQGAFSYPELCRRLENLEGFSIKGDRLIWLDGRSTWRCVGEIYSIGGISS